MSKNIGIATETGNGKLVKDGFTPQNPNQERWDKAIEHAKGMLELYRSIPMGFLGSSNIVVLLEWYEQGDRSESLLESLESIE